MRSFRGAISLCLAFSASAGLVAACGSSSSNSTHASSTAASSSAASVAVPKFATPEASIPPALKAPTIKHGVTFKFGYQNPQAGIPALDEMQAGAASEAKALGGTMIAENDNGSLNTQVSNFKTLLAQHVTGIEVQPFVAQALSAELAQAKAAGVPVTATASPAYPGSTGSTTPGFAVNVMQGLDRCAYLNVKAVAAAAPGATFATITSTIPAAAVQDEIIREKYWAKKFGLKYVGSVSTGAGDLPPAGSQAMSAIIARYPNVKAVFVFTDTAAEGAATTQKTRAGGHIMVVGYSGDTAALQQIKEGTMFATCGTHFLQVGKEEAIGAYEAQTGQHPLPVIAVPVTEYTKSGRTNS